MLVQKIIILIQNRTNFLEYLFMEDSLEIVIILGLRNFRNFSTLPF